MTIKLCQRSGKPPWNCDCDIPCDPGGHWISLEKQDPPDNTVVETKIDDEKGERNVAKLKQIGSRLWWFADGSMYVYYTPTHWRPILEAK